MQCVLKKMERHNCIKMLLRSSNLRNYIIIATYRSAYPLAISVHVKISSATNNCLNERELSIHLDIRLLIWATVCVY